MWHIERDRYGRPRAICHRCGEIVTAASDALLGKRKSAHVCQRPKRAWSA